MPCGGGEQPSGVSSSGLAVWYRQVGPWCWWILEKPELPVSDCITSRAVVWNSEALEYLKKYL